MEKHEGFTPEKYLSHVLKNWTEFCRHHRKIEKAIADILEENKQLKAEIKELRK